MARSKHMCKLLCRNESLEGCGWAATAQPVSWFAHASGSKPVSFPSDCSRLGLRDTQYVRGLRDRMCPFKDSSLRLCVESCHLQMFGSIDRTL